jgi:ankyrin repeat protein
MKSIRGVVCCSMLFAVAALPAPQQPPDAGSREDALLGAVLLHDEARVKALLEEGVSANAKNKENDRTALFFAAEIGNAALVQLLLQHGADVTAKDKLHGETPVGAASRQRHADVVRLLLAKDASSAEVVAWNAVFQHSVPVLDAALATERLSAEALSFLLDEADRGGSAEVADRLKRAGALPARPVPVAESILTTYVGSYQNQEDAGLLTISVRNGALRASRDDTSFTLVALRPTYFVRDGHRFPTLQFEAQGGVVLAVTMRDGNAWTRYEKARARAR